MNPVLVTGGSGFLGMHLMESLLESGSNVRCLDIKKPEISNDRLEFIEGSFTQFEILKDALAGCKTVFHLASTTIPKTSNDDPLFDIQTNLSGTVAFLDLAVEREVSKFIFVSSGGTVYGEPVQIPVPEEHGTNPKCSYGIVKLSVEKYLYMYHRLYGLGTCILRISNPYGERQRIDTSQGAVSVFCHKALAGETIEIWGDGSVIRDYIYVKDVVRALICAANADCAGSIINIGSGEGTSLNQLLDQIGAICGRTLTRQYLPARSFDVPEIYLDISRAKNILEWQPLVSLTDGMTMLLDAMKTNHN